MKALPCCYPWLALFVPLQIRSIDAWINPTRPPLGGNRIRFPSQSLSSTALSVSPSEFGAFGADNARRGQISAPQPQLLPLRELYPATSARANGTIQVDSTHSVYYEVHGSGPTNFEMNAKTQRAALFLHGGPGAGCTPTHARFFDPELYDTIVLFDQRGCGRSTPRGQVVNNTLMHLIQDCERLREHILGEDGVWHTVLGGSWGSTLAIAYAQEFPLRVKSLVLRGVCLLRTSEVDWLFTPQGGAAQKNPEAWKAFAENVLGNQSSVNAATNRTSASEAATDRSVLHEYYDRFFGTNTTKRWVAARGWMGWEFTVSSSFKKELSESQTDSPAVLVSYSYPGGSAYQDRYGRVLESEEIDVMALESPDMKEHSLRQGLSQQSAYDSASDDHASLARPIGMNHLDFEEAQNEKMGNFSGLPALPMLTCYYSVNDQFAMNSCDLLSPSRMDQIRYLPCIAIQGGRDPICPPDTAFDLKQQMPGMELRVPLNAGHSMYHPELVHELVQATDRVGKFVT